jgi:hypothetical protein
MPKDTLEEMADEIKHLHAEVFAGMLSPLYVDKKVIEALTTAYNKGVEVGMGNMQQEATDSHTNNTLAMYQLFNNPDGEVSL